LVFDAGVVDMQLGVIGLGRMGGNISLRVMRAGHKAIVFDRSSDAVKKLTQEGAEGAGDLKSLVSSMEKPRTIWVMLPAGHITEQTIEELGTLLEPGDTIIDGGNTFYKDDIRRAKALRAKTINYVDVGTSGGVWGLERGYCMMIGGPKEIVDYLDPLFAALAPGMGNTERTRERHNRDPRPEQGYMYCGPAGSGHFVKMVHNGIEYGMMQAYAEGFDVLKTKSSVELAEDERFSIDVADVAEVWRRGSVVSSWLLWRITTRFPNSAAMLTIVAKAVGRWRPRSRRRCPCRCCRRRCMRGSGHVPEIRLVKNYFPPCATSLAAMSNSIDG
jgi:6-phosphogluconate dehydrogenase